MRARSLKPGFFKNEQLAELPPLTRILFQGLWCMADRRGRLEDRPRRIKAEVLPYDDWDVDAALDDLAANGFIVRYEVDGNRYIQVVNFERHQNPHVREPESMIPPPPGTGPDADVPVTDPVPAPDEHGARTMPAPGEHSASTVPAPGEHQPGPADSGLLTPDSGLLTPDSRAAPALPRERRLPSSPSSPDFDAVVESWNRICAGDGPGPPLPEVLGVTKQRRQRFVLRCRELARTLRDGEAVCELSWWERLFERIRASPFLRGEGESGWQATLDWLLESSEHVVRVLEGAYDARASPVGVRARASPNGTVTPERLSELERLYGAASDLAPSELMRREREAIQERKRREEAS